MTARSLRVVVASIAVLGVVTSACSDAASASPPVTAPPPVVPRAAAAVAATAPVRLSVIGDSFSSGSLNDIVWPEIVAGRHGADLQNASLGGAGYSAGVDELGTFADQIGEAVSIDPDVILVVGSENDVDEDPLEVAFDATSLYDELARSAPRATVVVIGPIWSGDAVPDEMRVVDAAVEDAALGAGVGYVDTLDDGWLADPSIIQNDGDHPTDEGQYLLAEAIDAALDRVDPHLLG